MNLWVFSLPFFSNKHMSKISLIWKREGCGGGQDSGQEGLWQLDEGAAHGTNVGYGQGEESQNCRLESRL